MPEPGVTVVSVGAVVDEPPRVAATTPPATAAPATANMMRTLADIPAAAAPAAAPATALVWLIVTLATRPCEDAVTRICKFPCTPFGRKPWATARP